MASALAQQLQAVQLLHGNAPGYKKPKGKPSLLFSSQKAADLDGAAIFEIGCQGFSDLCRLNPGFASLRDALFSHAASSTNRTQLQPDAIASLDAAILEFCMLLSPHFLSSASFRALEYLIRHFRVNEFNIDALLLAALPYHQTNEFVRLVQVLALDPKRGLWAWLQPSQSSGAALTRDVLVARCLRDSAVLQFIAKGAVKLGGLPGADHAGVGTAAPARLKLVSKTYLSFYAVTLVQVIRSAQGLDEVMLAQLLPYISSGLEPSAHVQYQDATLLIVAELCRKLQLRKAFVRSLVNSMLRHMHPTPEHTQVVLLTLSLMAQHQQSLTHVPEKALKALLAAPGMMDMLLALDAQGMELDPLLQLLATSLITHMLAAAQAAGPDPQDSEDTDAGAASTHELALLELVHAGLLQQVASHVTSQLLDAALPAGGAPTALPPVAVRCIQRVLRALDLRYPQGVEPAVQAALRGTAAKPPAAKGLPMAAGGAPAEGDDEEDEEDGGAGDQAGAAARSGALVVLLEGALSGSARAPCPDTTLTLAAAAASPSPSIRKAALLQLDASLTDPAASDTSRAELQALLLTALQDDELEVVGTAVGLASTSSLPPRTALPRLWPTLRRLAAIFFCPVKPEHPLKHARLAAAKCLPLLTHWSHNAGSTSSVAIAEAAAEAGSELSPPDAAVLAVLQYLLPSDRAPRLAVAAVSQAASCSGQPLLAALQPALDGPAAALLAACKGEPADTVAAASDGGAAASKKKGKKAAATATPDGSAAGEAAVPKAEQRAARAAAALAFQRALVERLAKSLSSSPAKAGAELSRVCAVARVQALQAAQQQLQDPEGLGVTQRAAAAAVAQSVLDSQGGWGMLRARHLLLLALHCALRHASLGKSTRSATAVAEAAAAAASLSATLRSLCVEELRFAAMLQDLAKLPATSAAAATSGPGGEIRSVTGLDELGLPTEGHSQQLGERPATLHAAVLSHALASALQASSGPAASNSGQGADTQAVFCTIAQLRPAAAFDAHLGLLLSKDVPQMQDRCAFLAAVAATPAAAAPTSAGATPTVTEAVQLAALRLLHHECHAASAAPELASALLTALPHLLAGSCSPQPAVRGAAFAVLQAASSVLFLHPSAHPVCAAAAHVLRALAPHAAQVVADPGALPSLLAAAFSSSPPSPGVGGAAPALAGQLGAVPPGHHAPAELDATPKRGARRKLPATPAAAAGDGTAAPGVAQSGAAEPEGVQLDVGLAQVAAVLEYLAGRLPGLQPQAVEDMAAAAAVLATCAACASAPLPAGANGLGDTAGAPAAAAAATQAAAKSPASSAARKLQRQVQVALLRPCAALLQTLTGPDLRSAPLPAVQQEVVVGLVRALFTPSHPKATHDPAASDVTQDAALAADAAALLLAVLSAPDAGGGPGAEGHAAASAAWVASMAPARRAVCGMFLAAPPSPASSVGQQPAASSHCSLLPSPMPAALLKALAFVASADRDSSCQAAARAALEHLPLPASAVAPLLLAALADAPAALADAANDGAGGVSPAPKKSKKAAKQAAAAAQGAPVGHGASAGTGAGAAAGKLLSGGPGLSSAILVLEVLQWKQVQGEAALLDPLQQLLHVLRPILTPLTQRLPSAGEDEAGLAVAAPAAAPAVSPTAATAADGSALAMASTGYAAQLVLATLELLARRSASAAQAAGPGGEAADVTAPLAAFDLELVLAVAQQAPDAAVRNAALTLMTVLAAALPERALRHVLQVLALVNTATATATSSDDYSQQVATTALAAVVPAWLASGDAAHDLRTLWAVVVTALPTFPRHRCLGVLKALLTATPPEQSLPIALLLLLQAIASQAAAAPLQSPGTASGLAARAAADGAQGLGEDASTWLTGLMEQLVLQVAPALRLRCLSQLLPAAVAASDQQAFGPVPRLATTFIASQLQARLLPLHDPEDAAEASELQHGCQQLMAQAVLLVQQLVALQRQSDESEDAVPAVPTVSRKAQKAIKAALSSLDAVFDGLQGLMSGPDYMQALLLLAQQPDARMRRRALRLFAKKAALLQEELALLATHPGVGRSTRVESADALMRAALQVCTLLVPQEDGSPSPLAAAPPLAQQDLLTCYALVARASSPAYTADILAPLPHVLQLLRANSHTAVRGGVMAAIAGLANACGSHMLALLPDAARGVLAAGSACAAELAAATAAHTGAVDTASAASAAAAAANKQAGKAAKHRKSAAGEAGSTAGTPATAAAAAQANEAATAAEAEVAERLLALEAVALEGSAILAAVTALVDKLGAFLSPYLPDLLQLLLHPGVLCCHASACARLAAAVRSKLHVQVPSRQLLGPLLAALPYALEASLESVQALLGMVAEAATAMPPAVAAAHYEAMFAFLLQALDVRSGAHAALAGREHDAEQAAVTALVALTLKLNEAKFKPLFLRLLDWARATGPAATAAGPSPTRSLSGAPAAGGVRIGRLITLFSVANGLADSLRGVFVPYFRYLLDLAVTCLMSPVGEALQLGGPGVGMEGEGGKTPKKKKQRQQAEAAGSGEDAPGARQLAALQGWVLRGKVLRALHRCFLFDTVGFLDADKVGKLLPPLVAQLQALPGDAASTEAVTAQCADAGLEAGLKLGPRSPRDVYGTAAVAALVHLAVSANSDVHWKPLNRQVLLTTRSGAARTRCLALEVVAHLVDRLREEYLVLLPETIPFLSELLEDPERAVEGRAQDVLRQLEEVSGEKLDQYLKT